MHSSNLAQGPQISSVPPLKTIEQQIELFTNTWRQAVSNLDLEDVGYEVCDELKTVAVKAFENLEREFDPLIWPYIEWLTLDVAGIAEAELIAVIKKHLQEISQNIILCISEKISDHLEAMTYSYLSNDPSKIGEVDGASHG